MSRFSADDRAVQPWYTGCETRGMNRPRSSRLSLALLLAAASLGGCVADRPPIDWSDAPEEIGQVHSLLTSAQRRTRAGQIRDAAAAVGITQGWLLAGIADAKTNMSHCWSELTWACQGPNSSDCGGGDRVCIRAFSKSPCWFY